MNGLHVLAGIVVGTILLVVACIGDIIITRQTNSALCRDKGGVYIARVNACMKKEFLIPLN